MSWLPDTGKGRLLLKLCERVDIIQAAAKTTGRAAHTVADAVASSVGAKGILNTSKFNAAANCQKHLQR